MADLRVIISGGGTGGHIFPAISIANAIMELRPQAKILFVGALGRMEMERVPAAGYEIKGIPARGLKRPLYSPANIGVAIDYFKCRSMAKKIIKEFRPNLAVGVGGYASAAIVSAAASLEIPILLQEQNSYAGIVNKENGGKADKICVAYDGMERFFPKDKIILTGNPIRKEMTQCTPEMKEEGYKFYHLDPMLKTLFVVGGSLGCRTLNNCMRKAIAENKIDNFQVIWQCGKYYKKDTDAFMADHKCKNVYFTDFISRMDLALAAADVVVSRAGAGTISELCVAGKCTIFVPSPIVAEDHQTHNAMALVNKNAAEIVKDAEAEEKLMPAVKTLLASPAKVAEYEKNILTLAKPEASRTIAYECLKLAEKEEGTGDEKSVDLSGSAAKKEYKNVYFIGIGGIGMSAIARYYKHAGCNVSGYDRTPSDITKALESEGIAVHYEDEPSKVPTDKENTLIIYTPAIPSDMKELVKVNKEGYEIVKRSRALGHISANQECLAVSGSHGKTSTSTLIAHIYTSSGIGCSAFLGGISKNYSTNLLLSKNPVLVAEADEFDRSFLQLFPHIAVVTATDPDHLDIYGNVENMRAAFAQFASQIDAGGYLVMKRGIQLDLTNVKAKVVTYSYQNKSDFYASDIKPIIEGGKNTGHFDFTINYPREIIGGTGKIEHCTVGVPGWVYIENSVAAAAVALLGGVPAKEIKKAIATFIGVKRRFDIHYNSPEITYIDDYAHHPQEINTTISSIKEAFPGRRVTGIFQPHLYTRTRDLAPDFAKSLSMLDSLVLLDIYPARELPIPGITSKIIFDKVTAADKTMIMKEELAGLIEKRLDEHKIDLLVTFGAGDIDRFIEPITELIEKKYGDKK